MSEKHGSAVDAVHPSAVEPSGLRSSPLPIHPALSRVLSWTPEDVAHAAERLRAGDPPNKIETVDGKIINLEGAIEADALTSLDREVEPVENTTLKDDAAIRNHILRLIPLQVSEITRAIACVLSTTKEERAAFSRSLMSAAGKKGAARRHRRQTKGSELISSPQAKSKSGYPAWVEHFAALARCKPHTIREVFGLKDKSPDLFEMLKPTAQEPYRITHLGDARALAGRFAGKDPKAIQSRRDCLTYWKVERGGPEAGVKLVDCFPFFARRLRQNLDAYQTTTKEVVEGENYKLYLGTMERRGSCIADGGVDIVFADIVYGDIKMARQVATLALRILHKGGYLVIVNGNFENLRMLNAVAETTGLIERPTIHVQYLHAKGGLAKLGIRHIDACPYFVWSKGEIEHPIDHLHYVSETALGVNKNKGGGEGVHHLWQKNPKVLLEIFQALAPTLKGARVPRVADLCMGWGTSGVACRKLGWEFVGIEPLNDPKAQGGPRFSVAAEDIKNYECAWARAVGEKPDPGKSGKMKPARKNSKREVQS
jgi:hypothetical protein